MTFSLSFSGDSGSGRSPSTPQTLSSSLMWSSLPSSKSILRATSDIASHLSGNYQTQNPGTVRLKIREVSGESVNTHNTLRSTGFFLLVRAAPTVAGGGMSSGDSFCVLLGRADHNMGGQSEEALTSSAGQSEAGILRAKAQRVAKLNIDEHGEQQLSLHEPTSDHFNLSF